MPDPRGFDLIAELPDDGSRQKEVYARFGLTAFKAQVFDHALVNLLTVAGSIDGGMSSEQVDECFERLFRKTAGGLVTEVSNQSWLDPEDLQICRTAVSERNRLIHRFFRDHAENFMTSRGQQVMLDDLGAIADLIQRADDACQRVMMRIGQPHGFTEERVEREMREMLDRIGQDES
ncbi:hypothetical protein [Mycolicibacterium llatzerense]|uniref:hypothetical protein n=1 Tax=Mycolicibacterium llatzerense TaxID=280871 RepID=UPI0008DE7288|nr:hypothetical protein [Mycolicibacterium llatzerense]